MVEVKLKGLKISRAKGRYYVYVRSTGEAIVQGFEGNEAALRKHLGSPDMLGKYNAKRRREKREYPEKTLGWLVAWFTDPEQCNHFKGLVPDTRQRYKDALACLEDVFDDQLSDIETHDIVQARDRVEKKKWAAFADIMVTALVTMFGLAVERGWMKTNTAKGIKRTYKSDPNANREWQPEEWVTVIERAPKHLLIAYMLARYVGYRSQSTVAVEWSNYKPDPRFGMCFRMKHGKNEEEHWIPAAPVLQDFLADLRFGDAAGKIAVRSNGQPWKDAPQLQKQSSNFLTALAREGLVGKGLTEHGLRVTFAAEIKRITGANDDQVAAALGDRDTRMGRHYTRHVEQENRIIEVFFAKQNGGAKTNKNRTRIGKPEGSGFPKRRKSK